jgi:hypothetical protein
MSSPRNKNISVLQNIELRYTVGHPVPLRGALRNVPARGGDAVDADGDLTRVPEAYGRSRVVLTTLRLVSSSQLKAARATVAKVQSSPRRARIRRQPPRRESRDASASPVCSCVFLPLYLHTRPRVQRAPGFPCALFVFGGWQLIANLGRHAPRECGCVSVVWKQNPSTSSLRTQGPITPVV